MGSLRQAKKIRKLIDQMVDKPFEQAKSRRVGLVTSLIIVVADRPRQKSGIEELSLVDTLLEDYEKAGVVDERHEFLIKIATGQIYGGIEVEAFFSKSSAYFLILFQPESRLLVHFLFIQLVIFIYDNKSADVLQTFIFEMIHHPEVAKKAQDEMDRVIGKEQLPTLSDRPDLPYLDCIVREVFRYVFLLKQTLFTHETSTQNQSCGSVR